MASAISEAVCSSLAYHGEEPARHGGVPALGHPGGSRARPDCSLRNTIRTVTATGTCLTYYTGLIRALMRVYSRAKPPRLGRGTRAKVRGVLLPSWPDGRRTAAAGRQAG